MRNKELQQLLAMYDDDAEIAIGSDVHGFHGAAEDQHLGPIWVDHPIGHQLLIGRFMRNDVRHAARRTNSEYGIEQPNVYFARRTRERAG